MGFSNLVLFCINFADSFFSPWQATMKHMHCISENKFFTFLTPFISKKFKLSRNISFINSCELHLLICVSIYMQFFIEHIVFIQSCNFFNAYSNHQVFHSQNF